MADTWKSYDRVATKKEILLDKENTLASANYEKAKKEIRETDYIRTDSLEQFKKWISQNSHIENGITDDMFLLRFLRMKKFSIPMAQQTLLKYLNYRNEFSHVFHNLDYKDDKISELVNCGYIYASPFRDLECRRVVFYFIDKINLSSISDKDVLRADAITYETMLDDEETQVKGITHVICVGAISAAYLPLFATRDFGKLIKWGQQSFPLRHKLFSVINVSPYTKYIYDMAKRILSPKMRSRIFFDNTVEKVQRRLGTKCFPLEMGGVVPEKEMIELFKEEMAAKRDRILSFDKIKLLSSEGIITRRNCHTNDNTGIGSLDGSFRKLNID